MVVCDKSEVVAIWRQPEVSIDLTVGSGLMPSRMASASAITVFISENFQNFPKLRPSCPFQLLFSTRIEKVSYGCILPRS